MRKRVRRDEAAGASTRPAARSCDCPYQIARTGTLGRSFWFGAVWKPHGPNADLKTIAPLASMYPLIVPVLKLLGQLVLRGAGALSRTPLIWMRCKGAGNVGAPAKGGLTPLYSLCDVGQGKYCATVPAHETDPLWVMPLTLPAPAVSVSVQSDRHGITMPAYDSVTCPE